MAGSREKSLQAAYLERMCELGTSQFAQQGTFTVVAPDGTIRWITGEGTIAEKMIERYLDEV